MPGSSGSWNCQEVTADGTVITGFQDGINGGVTVPLGFHVRCTATNRTSFLKMGKIVVNSSGGTAVPDDWTLTATPLPPAPDGLDPVSMPGGSGTVSDVRPLQTYRLTESGPAGYTASSWQCVITDPGVGSRSGGDTVTLDRGATATCTITNTAQPAKLTLAKIVDADESGSGKTPADWTLTATPDSIPGQNPVTGDGDPNSPGGVNQVSVFAGTYTLSEAGPAGFTAGEWTCTGGTQDGDRITVPNGGAVNCSITNTAVAPRLTLIKLVDNGATGGTAVPTDWTLTASGPSTISGLSGSSAVTNAAARVGRYALSETGGPPGYSTAGFTCTGAVSFTSASVTLAEGSAATCTVKNIAKPAPTLTLVKKVVNAAGGTAVPTDWTLRAAGPVTISGVTGSAAVTSATVAAGTYALSESGPGGYTASAWTCTGGALNAAQVTVALAATVICTITNTQQVVPPPVPPPLPNTGAAVMPWLWTGFALIGLGALVLAATWKRRRSA